jgi:hypothetical protein
MDEQSRRVEAQRLAAFEANASIEAGTAPEEALRAYNATMAALAAGEQPAAAAEAPVEARAAPTWQGLIDSGELTTDHFAGMTHAELDQVEELHPGILQHAAVTLPRWRGEQEEGDRRRSLAAVDAERAGLDPEELVAREDVANLKARLPFLSPRQIKEEAGLHGLDADQLQREHDGEMKRRFDPVKDPRIAVDDEGGQ